MFPEYGFDIRMDDVALGITPDGRLSGIAYVEMVDSETAEAAKEKLHRKYLGKRFVEVNNFVEIRSCVAVASANISCLRFLSFA